MDWSQTGLSLITAQVQGQTTPKVWPWTQGSGIAGDPFSRQPSAISPPTPTQCPPLRLPLPPSHSESCRKKNTPNFPWDGGGIIRPRSGLIDQYYRPDTRSSQWGTNTWVWWRQQGDRQTALVLDLLTTAVRFGFDIFSC